ncbi:MAG TPA: putative Fe-S cluster assembly protein SufT [Gammaproteobacteria bacterium]|nr:putative Fe-S cluster assembly protein SufT [Gammaproteobacteria bacterium]
MHTNEEITLERDCEAVLIPSGTPIQLKQGSIVFITQALGGTYTVNINGNLARIAEKDADALGFEIASEEKEDEKELEGDGSVDEQKVWDQLRTCYDPEIPINIVDLGLIYNCEITPLEDGGGNRVDILMTLTAPGCGMGDFLAADVQQRVAAVPNVTDVNVELTFEPPWDQSMMSEAARLETGLL